MRGHHSIVVGAEFVRNQLNFRPATTPTATSPPPVCYSGSGPNGGNTIGDPDLDFLFGLQNVSSRAPSSRRPSAATSPASTCRTPGTPRRASPLLPAFAGRRTSSRRLLQPRLRLQHVRLPRRPGQHRLTPPRPQARSSTAIPAFLATSPATRPAQFSPNVGFSFDPSGNGKTVFRGGFEFTYDQPNFYTGQRNQQNPPFAPNVSQTQDTNSGPISLTNPWSTGPCRDRLTRLPYPPTATSAKFLPTVSVGRAALGVPSRLQPAVHGQHPAQLPARLADAAGLHRLEDQPHAARPYRSTRSTSSPAFGEQAAPAVLASCRPAPPLRSPVPPERPAPPPRTLFPAVPSCRSTPCRATSTPAAAAAPALPRSSMKAWANYNGIVASLQHRLSSNVQPAHQLHLVQVPQRAAMLRATSPPASSRSRSTCAPTTAPAAPTTGTSSTPPSSLSIPLPHGKSSRAAIVNGWQLAPIVHITSGAPFTVTSGVDNSFTSGGIDRPNLVPGAQVYTHNAIRSQNTPG